MDKNDLGKHTTIGADLPPLPWDLCATNRRIIMPLRAGELADAFEQYGRAVLALARPAPADALPLPEPLKFGIGLSHDYVAGYNEAIKDARAAHQAAPAEESTNLGGEATS